MVVWGRERGAQSSVVELGREKKFTKKLFKNFKRLGSVTCWNTSQMQVEVEILPRQL